ncbi:SMP-30/gluconolactonase/LRE family protein [Peristeroidobacter soli]|uniref:SMP-30/gluconolactonase/LRE family protein n=1 Tax=Peristeroidobacter soli TaxID=2497877 RepID=UPI00101C43F2|nr:SMP-30/gluconolactonase/LRE family protein [Peristeroidobacter soli]
MAEAWRVIAREERDELGEGPVWSARHNAIFWVDILSHFLYRYSLADGAVKRWTLPERIGWVAERRDRPGFIAGLQSGFFELDLEPFALRQIVDPEPHYPGNRLNDAKVDRHGRIWAGTMDAAIVEATGSLYCLRPDMSVRRVDEGYKVTNGPTFSLGQEFMYHTDSGRGTVYRFDLSPEGELSNKRVWLKFTAEMGSPDGMTVDADGFIWIAHWGGSRISRWSPDATLDREILLPAPQITSVAFAGPSLDRMFVTSAAKGLDRSKETFAGSLFEVDAGGVRGVAPGLFAG